MTAWAPAGSAQYRRRFWRRRNQWHRCAPGTRVPPGRSRDSAVGAGLRARRAHRPQL